MEKSDCMTWAAAPGKVRQFMPVEGGTLHGCHAGCTVSP